MSDIIRANPELCLSEGAVQEHATSSFLPRVEMAHGMSDVVSQKLAHPGDIVFNRETNLKDVMHTFIASRRVTGMFINERTLEAIAYQVASAEGERYIPSEEEFHRLRNLAQSGRQGYSFGIQALLWIFEVQSWATFFFGTKTIREIGFNKISVQIDEHKKQSEETGVYVGGLLYKCARWKVEQIPFTFKNKKTGERTPTKLNKPILTHVSNDDIKKKWAIPEGKDVIEQMKNFMNPPNIETAEEASSQDERPR